MVEPQATAPYRPQRFHLLDGLRLMAALAVVAYHYLALPETVAGAQLESVGAEVVRYSKYGAFGVDLFFVISGFVVLLSGLGRTGGQFVASRISRLFPAYWFAVLVTAAVMALMAPQATPTIQQVLANLTMVHSAFGVPDVDPVYWTLWVELHFYALVWILLLFRPSPTTILVFAVGWPIVGSLARITDSDFIATSLIAPHAPMFAAGMVIFCIHRFGHSVIAWLALAFVSAFAAVTSVPDLAGSIARNTGTSISPTVETALALGCIALVAVVTLTPFNRINGRWLVVAGAITYPLYLLHENVGIIVIDALEGTMGRWPATLLTTTLMCVVAYCISRFLEAPVGRLLRRRLETEFEMLRRSRPGRRRDTPRSSASASERSA